MPVGARAIEHGVTDFGARGAAPVASTGLFVGLFHQGFRDCGAVSRRRDHRQIQVPRRITKLGVAMQNRAPWFERQECRQESSAIVPLAPSFRRCIKGLLARVGSRLSHSHVSPALAGF